MQAKINIKNYIVIYTILFSIIILIVLLNFNGRTLIWNNDGKRQFLPALIYWGKYIREIWHNIVNYGKLVIPQFDLCIGEGEDILRCLNGCVMLDPFYILSAFVDEGNTWILYDILQIVRLYLIGLVFSFYCIKNNVMNIIGILAGAFTYMFCLFGLLNFARHPSFLNVMIFFPLLLIGIDDVIYKNKGKILTISVFLASISYFYMFYQMVVLIAIYSIIRLLYLYKKNLKIFLRIVFQIIKYSLLGLCIASFIVIPIIYIYLSSSRLGINVGINTFYPVLYYLRLPSMFIGIDKGMYWVYIGVASFSIISLIFLYIDKKHIAEKIYIFVLLIMLLIPFMGHIINAFSYVTNRWIFVLNFMIAYIVALKWDDILELKLSQFVKLYVLATIIIFVSLLTRETRVKPTVVSIAILLVSLLVIGIGLNIKNIKKIKEISLFILLLLNLFFNIHFFYSSYNGYANQMLTHEEINSIRNNEIEQLKKLLLSKKTNEFNRYSGRNISVNYSMLDKIASTATYWSYPNSNVYEYRRKLELPQSLVNAFYDYDDREVSMALDSVKYFIIDKNDKGIIPNGFHKINDSGVSDEKYNILETKNCLPIVYQYDKTISSTEWEKLNPIDKEEAMMEAIVVDNNDTLDSLVNYNSKTVNLNYSFVNKSEDIVLTNNIAYVLGANKKLVLKYDSSDINDIYLRITGLHFKGMTQWDYYNQDIKEIENTKYSKLNFESLDDSAKKQIFDGKFHYVEPTEIRLLLNNNSINKVIRYFTKYAAIHYSDWKNFTVYMGKSKKGQNQLSITFPAMGIYTFDKIEILKKNSTNLFDKNDNLKVNNLKEIDFETDIITTKIELNEKKWICFSIPYSKGWTAYIDGVKTKLYKANIKHMAVNCDSGVHNIILEYNRPGQFIGNIVSLIGILILIYLFVIKNRRELE